MNPQSFLEQASQEISPITASPSRGVELREVTSQHEREAIFRFRYEVYVERMQRQRTWVDHERRMIVEPLDVNGRLVGAFRGETIVGTCRLNLSSETRFEPGDFWGIDVFDRLYPGRVSLATKLMIDPGVRSSVLFARIVREMARLSLQKGACVSLIDCNDPVLPLFGRLGFVRYRRARHPEYGEVNLMAMFFGDGNHIRNVGSPLWPVVEPYLDEHLSLRHGAHLPRERESV